MERQPAPPISWGGDALQASTPMAGPQGLPISVAWGPCEILQREDGHLPGWGVAGGTEGKPL